MSNYGCQNKACPQMGAFVKQYYELTNEEALLQLGMGSNLLKPMVSALNSEICATLRANSEANYAFHMMSRIMECYFTAAVHTKAMDDLAERLLRSIMKNAIVLKLDPAGMEQETNLNCDCTHGVGLAAVTIAWMKYVYKKQIPLFVQFAVNVMGIQGLSSEQERLALDGILALEYFCKWLGLPVCMNELGIVKDKIELMAKKATCGDQYTPDNLEEPLTWLDVVEIYKLALH